MENFVFLIFYFPKNMRVSKEGKKFMYTRTLDTIKEEGFLENCNECSAKWLFLKNLKTNRLSRNEEKVKTSYQKVPYLNTQTLKKESCVLFLFLFFTE